MKTTLLLSIALTGIALMGCTKSADPSKTAGESYQNPPAADPKVAVDPSKPNSPSNTVEGAAKASRAAATEPGRATEPAMASTPSNISTRTPAVATSSPTRAAVANDSTKSTAAGTSNSDLSARITEWRLGAAAIQADVDHGVTIVRRKESIMGALPSNTDDAVVTAMVKGQLQADTEVSTARVDVKASGGEVTLSGTAANAAQVGHAIALALDTQGVTKVSSNIRVSK